MFISSISRHSFINFAILPSFSIISCRNFLLTIVVSLLYLFFQSSYLTVLSLVIYPFHVSFLYGLSPSFPSSSFSSSTFRSLISIHCNLSFRVHLQLHTTLSFQPLSFHRSSFNTSFSFFKPFFPHPLSCSSYTLSHSNLTITFFIPSPMFIFISLCH